MNLSEVSAAITGFKALADASGSQQENPNKNSVETAELLGLQEAGERLYAVCARRVAESSSPTRPDVISNAYEANEIQFRRENGFLEILSDSQEEPIVRFNENILSRNKEGQVLPFGEIVLNLSPKAEPKKRIRAVLVSDGAKSQFISREGEKVTNANQKLGTPTSMAEALTTILTILDERHIAQELNTDVSLNPTVFNVEQYWNWVGRTPQKNLSLEQFINHLKISEKQKTMTRRDLIAGMGLGLGGFMIGGGAGFLMGSTGRTESSSDETVSSPERERLRNFGLEAYIPLYEHYTKIAAIVGESAMYSTAGFMEQVVGRKSMPLILFEVALGRIDDKNSAEVRMLRDGWVLSENFKALPSDPAINLLVDRMTFETGSSGENPEALREYFRLFCHEFPFAARLIRNKVRILSAEAIGILGYSGTYLQGYGLDTISGFASAPASTLNTLAHEMDHGLYLDLEEAKESLTLEAYLHVQETRMKEILNLLNVWTRMSSRDVSESDYNNLVNWGWVEFNLKTKTQIEDEIQRLLAYIDTEGASRLTEEFSQGFTPGQQLTLLYHFYIKKYKEIGDKIRYQGTSSLTSEEIDIFNRIKQDGMIERLYKHLFHRSHERRLFSDWDSIISSNQEPVPIANLCMQVDIAWLDGLSRYPLGSIGLDDFRRLVENKVDVIAARSDSTRIESAPIQFAEEWLEIDGANELLSDYDAGIRLVEFPYHGKSFFVVQQGSWNLLVESQEGVGNSVNDWQLVKSTDGGLIIQSTNLGYHMELSSGVLQDDRGSPVRNDFMVRYKNHFIPAYSAFIGRVPSEVVNFVGNLKRKVPQGMSTIYVEGESVCVLPQKYDGENAYDIPTIKAIIEQVSGPSSQLPPLVFFKDSATETITPALQLDIPGFLLKDLAVQSLDALSGQIGLSSNAGFQYSATLLGEDSMQLSQFINDPLISISLISTYAKVSEYRDLTPNLLQQVSLVITKNGQIVYSVPVNASIIVDPDYQDFEYSQFSRQRSAE